MTRGSLAHSREKRMLLSPRYDGPVILELDGRYDDQLAPR